MPIYCADPRLMRHIICPRAFKCGGRFIHSIPKTTDILRAKNAELRTIRSNCSIIAKKRANAGRCALLYIKCRRLFAIGVIVCCAVITLRGCRFRHAAGIAICCIYCPRRAARTSFVFVNRFQRSGIFARSERRECPCCRFAAQSQRLLKRASRHFYAVYAKCCALGVCIDIAARFFDLNITVCVCCCYIGRIDRARYGFVSVAFGIQSDARRRRFEILARSRQRIARIRRRSV